MKAVGERSIKSLYMRWLILLAIADVSAFLLIVKPNAFDAGAIDLLGAGRLATTTVIPVVVLLLVNALPHELKAMAVFWKPYGVLPGSQAFTKYGPGDPRIDMDALKKNVGALPSEPKEQNAKWYKLYGQVKTETEVAESHKLFLMYRDMATISLMLAILVPLPLHFIGSTASVSSETAELLVVQYLLTALSARWSGIRFVCNVLAVHCTRKIGARKQPEA